MGSDVVEVEFKDLEFRAKSYLDFSEICEFFC